METNETVETAGNKMNDSEKIHLGHWNFLSVWALITLIAYVLDFFFDTWVNYIFTFAPVVAWFTYGYRHFVSIKSPLKLNKNEGTLFASWNILTLFTPLACLYSDGKNNTDFALYMSLFALSMAWLCLNIFKKKLHYSPFVCTLSAFIGIFGITSTTNSLYGSAHIAIGFLLLFYVWDAFEMKNAKDRV